MDKKISNQEAFSNKVVWITGASAGIGEEMAVAFARSGSKLVLSARNSEQLERVEKRCYEAGADREECASDAVRCSGFGCYARCC